MNYIAGGAGKAIMLVGDNLYGVANTLSGNSFDFSITGDDIRGGKKNVLLSKYFHDPNLAINLTNALFSFDDVALALGTTITHGGLSFYEEQVTGGTGSVEATQAPVAVHGRNIAWYRNVKDKIWKVGTFEGKKITISGATSKDTYCIKYFWENENARSMKLKADYEPAEVHLIIIQDLFAADIVEGDTVPGDKAGSLITDIPRFKLDGNSSLGFESGSTATTSLSGVAMAVNESTGCSDSFIYGTMTEEIYGAEWQDDVIAIAVENGDVDLEQRATEDLVVRAIFANNSSLRKPSSAFTFAVERTPASTASDTSVGAHDGKITAGSQAGACVVSVKLTDNPAVEPTYVHVTVAG